MLNETAAGAKILPLSWTSLALTLFVSFPAMLCKRPTAGIRSYRWAPWPWPTDCARLFKPHPANPTGSTVTVLSYPLGTDRCCFTACSTLAVNGKLIECFDRQSSNCRIESACVLRGVLGHALDAFFLSLDSYTLADLLAPKPKLAKMLVPTKKRSN